jgi:hypothetical protein
MAAAGEKMELFPKTGLYEEANASDKILFGVKIQN